MKFLPGQSGNPLGRPRKYDLRTKFIEDWAASNQDKITYTLNKLYAGVKKGYPWAIKEFLSYTIAKPKMSVETTSTELSEKRVIVYDALNGLSDEAKQALYAVLTKQPSEPISIEGEVVEESL